MIRSASRRLAHKARAMQEARAHVDEVTAELERLNTNLGEKLDGESRPDRRAAHVLAWASQSAEILAYFGELGGDMTEWDDVAVRILDVVRQAVEDVVPAMVEEEVPHLGRENVADFVTVALEALREEGTPVAPAVPIIAAILAWHVDVYGALARSDAGALRRLALVAPYENARRLAEIFGGVIGPIVDRAASRLIARTRAVAVDEITEISRRASRCRRRGPPPTRAATPRTTRHVVGTSPNAPPSAPWNGAVAGMRVRRGKAEGEPLRT